LIHEREPLSTTMARFACAPIFGKGTKRAGLVDWTGVFEEHSG
jgi:hypothetical protein